MDKIKQTISLNRSFYSVKAEDVAEKLLGKVIVCSKGGNAAGIITETEAYYGRRDPASHAYRGKTPRTKLMFGKPGIAYIYLCYGMYHLFNIVTEREGEAGAVLIRKVFPMEGISLMQERRGIKDIRKLANGPGKLTIAMGIDLRDNGKDITDSRNDLSIADFGIIIYKRDISRGKRIGIKNGKDKLLRFYVGEEKLEDYINLD
ncbi:MAG: DNA-3-methyladenine glycosylase [Candidatus Humimicrobiaceae bacterium]